MFKFIRARAKDPITSFESAAKVDQFGGKHSEMILNALHRFGPMGKDAIAEKIGLQGYQVSKRLKELELIDKIELTGKKVKSNSGNSEREWRVKPVQRKFEFSLTSLLKKKVEDSNEIKTRIVPGYAWYDPKHVRSDP